MGDLDDEIQQPPPKRRNTKYEGLNVVELKKLCKERGLHHRLQNFVQVDVLQSFETVQRSEISTQNFVAPKCVPSCYFCAR